MLAWNELLTDLAWREILHRHFRPLQNRKLITLKWLTDGKQLQEVAVWGTLKKPPSSRPILIYFAFTHYCHLHKPSLAQQILYDCDKILFSHTQRRYLFLFLDYFIIFRYFLLFYVIINFYKKKIITVISLYFFFMKIIFIFSCSGMFRNVPCSGFYQRPQ